MWLRLFGSAVHAEFVSSKLLLLSYVHRRVNINRLISRYQSLSHMQISGPISHMILSLRSNMLSVAYSSLQCERADFDSPPLQFYAPESRQCFAHASRATIANVKSPLTVTWTRLISISQPFQRKAQAILLCAFGPSSPSSAW